MSIDLVQANPRTYHHLRTQGFKAQLLQPQSKDAFRYFQPLPFLLDLKGPGQERARRHGEPSFCLLAVV